MSLLRFLIPIFLFAFALPVFAEDNPPKLSETDKEELDELFKEFLFNPKGAERVRVKLNKWKLGGEKTTVEELGWYVKGEAGKQGRVYFTDGASIPAPPEKEMEKIDFVKVCREYYSEKEQDFKKSPAEFHLISGAWLYRLGELELAAKILDENSDYPFNKSFIPEYVRGRLAEKCYEKLVLAYGAFADEEALEIGERMLRLYERKIKFEKYPVGQIVKDLKDRKRKGTFGKKPSDKWPEGFEKWEVKKKVAYLIESLEDVSVSSLGGLSSWDFKKMSKDRHYKELLACGEAGISALIDAFAEDTRTTRSCHHNSPDWGEGDYDLVSVQRIAADLLEKLLNEPIFDPNFPEQANGKLLAFDTKEDLVNRYRNYWNAYGNLPYEERLMMTLKHSKVNFSIRAKAAWALVTYSSPTQKSGEPNRLLTKFSKPSIAEAILVLRDDQRKEQDAGLLSPDRPAPEPSEVFRNRFQLDEPYLRMLESLNDPRILDELNKRYEKLGSLFERVAWANTLAKLGEKKHLREIVKDFSKEKIDLDAEGLNWETLNLLIEVLVKSSDPDCTNLLFEMANPKHRNFKALKERILYISPFQENENIAFTHPYCLAILKDSLKDTSSLNLTYQVDKGWVKYTIRSSDGWVGFSREISPSLKGHEFSNEETEVPVCNYAAELLSSRVIGLPAYHPSLKASNEKFKALKTAFTESKFKYRVATKEERKLFDIQSNDTYFIPDFPKLARAATPDDVKAGKAIFSLEGKGKLTDLKLPATAILKGDEKNDNPERVLIVQAERNDKGEIVYGAITRRSVRTFTEKELTEIKPLPKE